jgi:hypothetical protein
MACANGALSPRNCGNLAWSDPAHPIAEQLFVTRRGSLPADSMNSRTLQPPSEVGLT